MRKLLLGLFILSNSFLAKSQQKPDSTLLKEVQVKAYFSEQPLLRLPASVGIIGANVLKNYPEFSLVSAVNSTPGVRMEERSPGSYRLSIRGSLLRSPFGIRNVKIYLDNYLLTDAGGNTYLNILDAGSADGIEIIKGPEGSIYGANSGGVVLIRPFTTDSTLLKASITGGSFGLFHEKIALQKRWKKFELGFKQAYQRSDGYREHSSMDRSYFQLTPQWNYSSAGALKAMFLFSDLSYQTPGGLTLDQFNAQPRSARPGNTGAIAQHASIYNKTYFAGLSNEYQFGKNLKHVIALTASHTDFENPTFTNYELRDEASLGLRTFGELSQEEILNFKVQAGVELQQTKLDVDRFINNAGIKGDLTKSDYLQARQGFGFVHGSISPFTKLFLESALSINMFGYKYKSFFPSPIALSKRNFKDQLMPRFAASYHFIPALAIRASVSKGYSPPTLEEVNPSGQAINTSIQAEKGWNREAGFRLSLWSNKLYWDAVYFNYELKEAIVRSPEVNNSYYYLNAGGTKQQGLESELVGKLLNKHTGLVRFLELRNSFTYNKFSFADYVNSGTSFSGNRLTGVPRKVIVSSAEVSFSKEISIFLQHNCTSSLPLNDANTVYSKNCHLFDIKASWGYKLFKSNFQVFAGANNLFNKKYSLGYDLNAMFGRYYNAAQTRNFYAGLATSLK